MRTGDDGASTDTPADAQFGRHGSAITNFQLRTRRFASSQTAAVDDDDDRFGGAATLRWRTLSCRKVAKIRLNPGFPFVYRALMSGSILAAGSISFASSISLRHRNLCPDQIDG
jgi:endoglucanase Acf2